ncbi:hypothetical protein PG984_010704 [Apiospora sp. TS-2023a]
MASTGETNNNKAEGSARQSNITNNSTSSSASSTTNNTSIGTFHISHHYHESLKFVAREYPTVARVSQQENGPELVDNFLKSMGESPQLAHVHDNDFPKANGVTTTSNRSMNHLGPKSPTGFPHDDEVLGSSWLETDLPLCLEQYHSAESSRRVLDILTQNERRKINLWLSSAEYEDLFVRRSTSHTVSDWTTDLTLEIMGIIIGENEANHQRRPILGHFCKQNADRKDWGWGGIIVQDLVTQLQNIQIIEGRPSEGFSKHNGNQHHHTLENPAEVWEQFRQCVVSNQAKTVFVFIDNLDWMLKDMEEVDFENFIDGLERVRSELRSSNSVIKVWWTCSKHSLEIEKHFQDGGVLKLFMNQQPSSRLHGGSSQG